MIKNLFAILVVAGFVLFYTGCENSTDPKDSLGETEVENALKEVDALIGTALNSKTMSAVLFMPDLPFALPGIGSGFMKLSGDGVYLSKVQDSSFFDFITSLDSLFGTYTYNGETWIYSSGPGGSIVFVYPYYSLADAQQHTAEINLYNFVITNSAVSISLAVDIDEENHFEAVINLQGSGFLDPTGNGSLNNVFVNGRMTDSDGKYVLFAIASTNTKVEIGIEGSLENKINIIVAGTNILPADLSEDNTEKRQITEVKIEYGDVVIVINEFNKETGDIGDVLYQEEKVGDFIVKEEGQQYLKFNSGRETNMASLMVNLNLAMNLLGNG